MIIKWGVHQLVVSKAKTDDIDLCKVFAVLP